MVTNTLLPRGLLILYVVFSSFIQHQYRDCFFFLSLFYPFIALAFSWLASPHTHLSFIRPPRFLPPLTLRPVAGILNRCSRLKPSTVTFTLKQNTKIHKKIYSLDVLVDHEDYRAILFSFLICSIIMNVTRGPLPDTSVYRSITLSPSQSVLHAAAGRYMAQGWSQWGEPSNAHDPGQYSMFVCLWPVMNDSYRAAMARLSERSRIYGWY